MNKLMFWSGFSMIALEVLSVLGYLAFTSHFLTLKLLLLVMSGVIVALFNIMGIAFMIIGALSEERGQL